MTGAAIDDPNTCGAGWMYRASEGSLGASSAYDQVCRHRLAMKGMNLLLNPKQTPDAWRTFLYDQVLLPWETRSFQCRADVYSKSAVEMMLGLLALKKN